MWTLKGYQNLRCRKINVKISLLRSKGGITSDDQEYKSIFQSQEICMREVSHDRSYQEPRNLYFKAVSHVNIGQVSREQSLSKQYFINQELTSLPSKLPLQILTLKGSETTGTWRDWQGGKKKSRRQRRNCKHHPAPLQISSLEQASSWGRGRFNIELVVELFFKFFSFLLLTVD